MSEFSVRADGLEDHIERLVEEKLATARAYREPEGWLTSEQAAAYLGVAVSTIHDLTSSGALPRYGEKGHRIRLLPVRGTGSRGRPAT